MKRTLCRLVLGVAALGIPATAHAGFPQQPPFPPVAVEPLPPIIIPDPPIIPPDPPVQQTPEPATIGMALIGAGAALVARRRRNAQA